MVERKVEEIKRLEDGKHVGVITEVKYRSEPFEYVDLHIEAEGCKVTCGYPFKIMPESKLGLALKSFGAVLEIGNMIDPDKYFIGKKCSFITITKGKYSNVISESVQPLRE